MKKSNKSGDYKEVLEENQRREQMKKKIKEHESLDSKYMKVRSQTSE